MVTQSLWLWHRSFNTKIIILRQLNSFFFLSLSYRESVYPSGTHSCLWNIWSLVDGNSRCNCIYHRVHIQNLWCLIGIENPLGTVPPQNCEFSGIVSHLSIVHDPLYTNKYRCISNSPPRIRNPWNTFPLILSKHANILILFFVLHRHGRIN